VNTQLFLIPGT